MADEFQARLSMTFKPSSTSPTETIPVLELKDDLTTKKIARYPFQATTTSTAFTFPGLSNARLMIVRNTGVTGSFSISADTSGSHANPLPLLGPGDFAFIPLDPAAGAPRHKTASGTADGEVWIVPD